MLTKEQMISHIQAKFDSMGFAIEREMAIAVIELMKSFFSFDLQVPNIPINTLADLDTINEKDPDFLPDFAKIVQEQYSKDSIDYAIIDFCKKLQKTAHSTGMRRGKLAKELHLRKEIKLCRRAIDTRIKNLIQNKHLFETESKEISLNEKSSPFSQP